MTEPTRRTTITLTFATNEHPAELLYAVLAAVRDEADRDIETANVHTFDLADDELEPAVQFVIRDGGIYAVHLDDPERADDQAREIGGVVAYLPIELDCRREAVQVPGQAGR